MNEKEKLLILQPISKNLFPQSSPLQEIFTKEYTGIFNKTELVHHVYINKKKLSTMRPGFVSLGVDTLFSLIKHLPGNSNNTKEQLIIIIYIKGMEHSLIDNNKAYD